MAIDPASAGGVITWRLAHGAMEGEATVERPLRVDAAGWLNRVFAVGGQWFAEVDFDPPGCGPVILPLIAVRVEGSGAKLPGVTASPHG